MRTLRDECLIKSRQNGLSELWYIGNFDEVYWDIYEGYQAFYILKRTYF